jgi:peptidoglycan/xylan/chitin deacetylase (PgdA/CDA1 family)
VSKNFGFETSQYFIGLLLEEYKNFLARKFVRSNSFAELSRSQIENQIIPWKILRYDRISSLTPQDDLIVSGPSIHPLAFREQMKYLKANTNVISLNSLVSDLKQMKPVSPETVVITFDGGHKEHYEIVLPILKELSLCGTFFLPTEVIGSDILPWQDQVAHAVSVLISSDRNFPVLESVDPKIAVELKESFERTKSKSNLVRAVVAAIELTALSDRDECLAELSEAISGLNYVEPERVYLNWNEVWQMFDAGLEIGSLGRFGIPVNELSESDLAEELHASFDTLFAMDINASRVFALPKGSVTSESESFLFNMGFPYAVGENYFSPIQIPNQSRILKRLSINRFTAPNLDRFICRVAQKKIPGLKAYF